jgi:tetratricopeptide (TPR) repeat protein
MNTSLFPRRVLCLAVGLLAAVLLALPARPAWAQGSSSGPTKQVKLEHYSLYYENFRNDDFKSALRDLRWILENAPTFPQGDDRNFERAVDTYTALAEDASGDTKTAYLDTAATYLAEAPQRMDEMGADYSKYEWELERGRFMQQFGDALSAPPDALKAAEVHYRNAFDLQPEEIDPYYINRILRGYVNDGAQDKALSFMNAVEKARGDEEDVMKIVDEVRNRIFSQNPDARIAYLKEQMDAGERDPAMMFELYEAYLNRGSRDQARALADSLLNMNPSSIDVYRRIAKMYLSDAESQQAFGTYQQAINQLGESALTAEDFYNMGRAQQQMGELSTARTYFRRALDRDSDMGRAYLRIGELYTTAVSNCSGSKMERNDRAVYWLAVDYFQRAKSANSNVASEADSKIQTYQRVFPTNESIFFRDDWEVGESFRIDYGCYSWIAESTTVRKAP